ncbi:hypothetical protein SDC9_102136 [bioreactor metagenome]|uniref:Uncharacterized protein n=1 Tax=bioreactor metagenome TaxID=1076179 RepID=A0A645APZ7_9ZZZZ
MSMPVFRVIAALFKTQLSLQGRDIGVNHRQEFINGQYDPP